MNSYTSLVAGLLLACVLPGSALAQKSDTAASPAGSTAADTQQTLEVMPGMTGDWGGLRPRLHDSGIDLSFSALSEVATNVAGGARKDVTQVSGFALGLDVDTEKLAGLHGGHFQTIFTKRQGPALINRAGLNTLMPAQEIYARGQTYRLTDFWYQQSLKGGIDLKLGRMTMGEDFATLPCDFMNLSFCGNPVGNLVGNYWYNGPISQWAGRLRVRSRTAAFMVGVYEYNPNNLKEDIALFHKGAKGVTVPAELSFTPMLGGLPSTIKVGGWYSTAKAADLLEDANGDPYAVTGLAAAQRRGRYGGYVLVHQQLTGTFEQAGDGVRTTHGLSVFLNFTQADRRTTRTDSQAALWLVQLGTLKTRPDDDIGLGIARTNVNGRAARSEALQKPGSTEADAEYTAEFYYGIHVRDWLTIRPNVQYVFHPGGYSDARDIVVLGVKSALVL